MTKRNQGSSGSAITEEVAMDTRKFLSAVNNSAQAQITFFEDAVAKLGEQNDRKWTLTALQGNRLIIEDKESSEFMVADHSKEKGGRVSITNIKKIALHEGKKPELFEHSCGTLVDAIEEGDAKKIDAAYKRVAASRFRSTAIPNNGIVRTKDGIVRHVSVDEQVESGDSLAERLIAALSDKFIINESGIEGSFIDNDFSDLKLGVTELTTRKLVARNMRAVAEEAYKSGNFQTLVETIAGLVCKDDLEQAVDYAAKFLHEHQEFCLLDANGWGKLVNDALATRMCFNEDLASDTATLLRKTNLKINREELIEAWRITAEKAQHPVMLENVDRLSLAPRFEDAYEEFLPTILEATGETTRGALLAGLEMLKQKVADGDVDEPTTDELEQLISDLKNNGDSAALWKAMETLDGVRRSIDQMKGLDDFDEMPGPMADEEVPPGETGEELGGAAFGGAGAGADVDASGGGDKPLEISVKMDPAAMAQSAQAVAPAPESGGEGEEDFDLSDLDDIDLEDEGEEGEEGLGDEEDELALAASRNRGDAIAEDDLVKAFLTSELGEKAAKKGGIVVEKKEDEDEEEDEEDEDEEVKESDAYSLPGDVKLEDAPINHEYMTEEGFSDSDVIEFGNGLGNDGNGNDDDPDTMQAAAEAWVREKKQDRVRGIRDPKQQQQTVTDMAGELIAKRLEQRKVESAEGEEEIQEDQYKSPLKQLAKRGLKKAAISKLVKEGKLQWLKREEKAVLGEFNGIKFVIDRTEEPIVLLSEDGEVQVPIPADMVAGALYISESSDEEASADEFVEWLNEHIESLRREAGKSIDEQAAKITKDSKASGMESVEETAEPSGEEAGLQEGDVEDGEEDISEGGLPAHLEKHKFKSGSKKDESEESEESEESDDSDDSEENKDE